MTDPTVVLRGDADQPLRAECPDCGGDVDVTRPGWTTGPVLDAHDVQPGLQCPGSYTPVQ
jgi:hypothetical protein